jgi:sensor histidine kinase YesM
MQIKSLDVNRKVVIIDLLLTSVISTFVAIFLTVNKIKGPFIASFIISQCIGLLTCGSILFLHWIIKPKNLTVLILISFLGIVTGVAIGWNAGTFILAEYFSFHIPISDDYFVRTGFLGFTISAVISYFFLLRESLKKSKKEAEEERLKRLSIEKGVLEANLKLLQAQIEPHFLFNTLSNIFSLIDTDKAKSKAMLKDLINYLRTSLSRTRRDLITIGEEIELIKSYLNILEVRMSDRLRYKIELPGDLKEHPFPPMLLQPLVENSVKHGLEPKIEGGEILIRVTEDRDIIRLEVTDTGIQFSPYYDSGVGISNVKERLNLLYGEMGRLILEENKPSGLKAIIEVPKNHV